MPVPVAHLRACPLFAGFTDTGLEIFASLARPREVPKGLPVYAAGSPGEGLFIVAGGKLEVLGGQPQRVLSQLGPGDSFGELALLRAAPRTVGVRALEAAKLVEI